MPNKCILKLLQALCLQTTTKSLLCLLCKIFFRQLEFSILEDVTPSHKAKCVTKGLEERLYFTLMT
jgi:hypothetical protein